MSADLVEVMLSFVSTPHRRRKKIRRRFRI